MYKIKYGIKDNIRHYDVTGKICPKWFVDNPSEWEKFKLELEGNEDMTRYKTIEEMPVYAQDAIEKLVNDGILAGRGKDNLDLTEDMIRTLLLCKKMIEFYKNN